MSWTRNFLNDLGGAAGEALENVREGAAAAALGMFQNTQATAVHGNDVPVQVGVTAEGGGLAYGPGRVSAVPAWVWPAAVVGLLAGGGLLLMVRN